MYCPHKHHCTNIPYNHQSCDFIRSLTCIHKSIHKSIHTILLPLFLSVFSPLSLTHTLIHIYACVAITIIQRLPTAPRREGEARVGSIGILIIKPAVRKDAEGTGTMMGFILESGLNLAVYIYIFLTST